MYVVIVFRNYILWILHEKWVKPILNPTPLFNLYSISSFIFDSYFCKFFILKFLHN